MFSPNQQMPVQGRMLSVQVPSATNYGGNDFSNTARDGVDNGGFYEAEAAVHPSKKLENDMKLLGKSIKQHEENVKHLKSCKNSMDEEITDLQVSLGKYHSTTVPKVEDEDVSHLQSVEATVERIMQQEKSAAGIWCQVKRHRNPAAQTYTKDILGIVATLGKVDDDNLSRLLSEYLGLDNMLALVCITNDSVKRLEAYDEQGSVIKSAGLHGLGTSIGRTLEGRFHVICLENMVPYVGDFMPNDPQRRLSLLKPRLPSGETPPGFLGFAVNMIHVDNVHLSFLTADGCGLRETLFYSLFSRMQVYRTRADMLQALPLLCDGAISLDGGMLRRNCVYSLGTRGEMDVKFPIISGASHLPEEYLDTEKKLAELKWRKERMVEELQREEGMLAHSKFKFEVKKQEFLGFMAQSSPYTMPYPMQATPGRSTPR